MSETQQTPQTSAPTGGYGYASDEVRQSPFNFGGNFGVARLVKFEWIPSGGKDGAEQEALDIVFNINGTDKNYRMFPVVKAFGKNQEEITDPNAPEFKEAITDFNARITHILHAFVDSEVIKTAMSRPINSFKEYCQIAMSILPTNYKDVPLDIFLQFQWQMSEGQERTYLEVPRKMKYGRWLSPAIPGTWTEHKKENPTERDREALYYTNEKGEKHPFIKSGWFMTSHFAIQQKTASAAASTSSTTATAASSVPTPDPQKKASAW